MATLLYLDLLSLLAFQESQPSPRRRVPRLYSCRRPDRTPCLPGSPTPVLRRPPSPQVTLARSDVRRSAVPTPPSTHPTTIHPSTRPLWPRLASTGVGRAAIPHRFNPSIPHPSSAPPVGLSPYKSWSPPRVVVVKRKETRRGADGPGLDTEGRRLLHPEDICCSQSQPQDVQQAPICSSLAVQRFAGLGRLRPLK